MGGKVELGLGAPRPTSSTRSATKSATACMRSSQAVVNSWLQNDIGMWYGELDDDGVDQLIEELGGYPATYQDQHGVARPFGPSQMQVIRAIVQQYTNYGSWDPAAINFSASQEGPWTECQAWQRPWNSPQLIGIQLSELSQGPAAIGFSSTIGITRGSGCRTRQSRWSIARVENYSAMSEKELFANAYAEYFKDPAGKKDPTKWGGILPDDVKQFFAKNDRQSPAPTPRMRSRRSTPTNSYRDDRDEHLLPLSPGVQLRPHLHGGACVRDTHHPPPPGPSAAPRWRVSGVRMRGMW